MPAPREILKHVCVEVAVRQRICHRDRKKCCVPKGEPCLVIRNDSGLGDRNYCRLHAKPILERARADLNAFLAELT